MRLQQRDRAMQWLGARGFFAWSLSLRQAFPSCAVQFGRTALHCAAALGNEHIVHALLQNDALVNARNEDGASPLHTACWSGHAEASRMLIRFGADVSLADYVRVLHVAVVFHFDDFL